MARGETGDIRKAKGRRAVPRAGKSARSVPKQKQDCERLEAELHVARQRIEILEAQRADILSRIDRIVDSLHSLLAGEQ